VQVRREDGHERRALERILRKRGRQTGLRGGEAARVPIRVRPRRVVRRGFQGPSAREQAAARLRACAVQEEPDHCQDEQGKTARPGEERRGQEDQEDVAAADVEQDSTHPASIGGRPASFKRTLAAGLSSSPRRDQSPR
jgi:hypothetical protein